MDSAQRVAQLVTVTILATTICASAEVRKEFRFTVAPRAAISVINQYGPMPPGRAVYLLRQACKSLAEAHHLGMVHRDLKPANILLDGKFSVRVADLGLAQKYVTAKAVKELVGTRLLNDQVPIQ